MAFAIPLAIGAAVAGAGIQAYGTYESGQAASKEALYRQGYAQQLAGAYETRGQQMQAAGYQQAQDVGLRYGAQAARGRVFAGAGNIAGGSPAAVTGSTLALGQLAQRTTIANAGERAYGEFLRGAEQRAGAGLYGTAAQQDVIAGDISATGDVISGVGKAASMAAAPGSPFAPAATPGGGGAGSVDPKWYTNSGTSYDPNAPYGGGY
jgi:hypothetical protein